MSKTGSGPGGVIIAMVIVTDVVVGNSVPSSGLIHKWPSFLEYLLTTHSLQLCLSVGTALPKIKPSLLHISRVAHGQWLPAWRFKSLTLLPHFRRVLKGHSGSRIPHRICFGLSYNLNTSAFLFLPKLAFFASSHMYTSRTLPSKPSAANSRLRILWYKKQF